ncbi:inter-alpha-trypsin inhibitor heavy chain H3-like isoform X2 [Antedon mediterranea]
MEMDAYFALVLVLIASWLVNDTSAASAFLTMKRNSFDEIEKTLERVERDVDSATHIKPEITKLNVRSSVTSRFSSTTVTSVLMNHAETAAEAVFIFTLPEEAFIANFSMEIDGVVYPAEIKEKEVASQIYQEARSKGQSAAQVKQKSEKDFTVSVNVAKKSFVTFELIYQEMLRRKLSYFEHVTSVRPGQVVKEMSVEVVIIEVQGLLEVNSSWVERRDNGDEETKQDVGEIQLQDRNTKAVLRYAPTIDEQRQESENGIQGYFIIRYDVEHPKTGGEFQIVNGYFVHYFSPEGLPAVRKNVVFVIDVSGSMSGRKIQQTKQAMFTILDDLREIDFFNIVKFNSEIIKWQSSLKRASPENIGSGKKFIDLLRAHGATNLHGGLMEGIELLHAGSDNSGVSMVVMLTDGLPTSGVTSFGRIQTDVKQAIKGNCSLFNIGFGDYVDYSFLETLALRNDGLARKIYDDSYASIQLKGFFDEVSTPLLHNIVFNYPEHLVEINSVTQTKFSNYFEGTEIVVSGKLKPSNINDILDVTIAANSLDVHLEFPLTIDTEPKVEILSEDAVDDFAQRLWAYLSIKELLQKRNISDNQSERDDLKDKALQLSLEYHFVTPLTSLIVVKPENGNSSKIAKQAQQPIRKSSGAGSSASSASASVPYRSGRRNSFGSSYSGIVPANIPISSGGSYSVQKTKGTRPTHSERFQNFMSGAGAFLLSNFETTTREQTTQVTTTRPTTLGTTTSQPTQRDRTSVGVTHYLVRSPDYGLFVCFNIEGYPGDVYRLIQDPKQGINVKGELSVTPYYLNAEKSKLPFLRKINVEYRNSTIVVTPSYMKVEDVVLFWQNIHWRGDQHLSLTVTNDKVRVMIGTDITLIVMRHRYPRGSSNQVYYLGLYVEVGRGFSDEVHGLIGQFYRRNRHIQLTDLNFDQSIKGTIHVNSRQVPGTLKYADEPWPGTIQTRCWFADNNGMGLIDGWHGDYLNV